MRTLYFCPVVSSIFFQPNFAALPVRRGRGASTYLLSYLLTYLHTYILTYFWLVWMEWRPAGWSLCLPLLIFPCTIKSRSSLLAPAHLGGPGKRAAKRLYVCVTYLLPYFAAKQGKRVYTVDGCHEKWTLSQLCRSYHPRRPERRR